MRSNFPLVPQELLGLFGAGGVILAIGRELGLGLGSAATLAATWFLASSAVWSTARLWSDRKTRFKLFRASEWSSAVRRLSFARRSVLATHFSESEPPDVYLAGLIDRLEHNVGVHRLVRTPTHKRGDLRNKLHSYSAYRETVFPSVPLPFDFLILDNRRVDLFLGTSSESRVFDMGLSIENPDVADLFRTMFVKLEREAIQARLSLEAGDR